MEHVTVSQTGGFDGVGAGHSDEFILICQEDYEAPFAVAGAYGGRQGFGDFSPARGSALLGGRCDELGREWPLVLSEAAGGPGGEHRIIASFCLGEDGVVEERMFEGGSVIGNNVSHGVVRSSGSARTRAWRLVPANPNDGSGDPHFAVIWHGFVGHAGSEGGQHLVALAGRLVTCCLS